MLVDTDRLGEMHAALGREGIDDVVEELDRCLHALTADLDSLTRDEMGTRAHTLKGACSHLGTEDVYRAAYAADQAYKKGEDPQPHLENLASLIEPTLRELRAAVAELG